MDVFGSVFDGDKADWVVDHPDKGFLKIQVRWASKKGHGLPRLSLLCTEGHGKKRRFKDGEFDFIIGYDLYTDTAYVWSREDLKEHRASVTIHEDAAEAWHKLDK